MIDASGKKIDGYDFQKGDDNKNKITVDSTNYKMTVIKGKRQPRENGPTVDKIIFDINIKEDGRTIVDKTYTSTQKGEEGNIYSVQ